MAMPETWDIFCRVVDNYGDAGVCWRLARRIREKGGTVRLWIDDLATLEHLHPGIATVATQLVEGIEVRSLRDQTLTAPPAQVVIEAFGCGLPDAYVVAMAGARPSSLWIVLEYLSAEPWVSQHHGLPSPHPHLDVQRYFFFPGFAEGTGGLLLEPDLLARRDAFGQREREAFWRDTGYGTPPEDATVVSLFGYESAPVGELLEAWVESRAPIVAAVPEGRLLPSVLGHFGLPPASARRVLERGALQLRVMPFVPQTRYDELLWSCDINFVRGEDSFVRAQWAGRPFVWQIYPQEDRSHWPKLHAFIDRYCESARSEVGDAVQALTMSWNGVTAPGSLPPAWGAFSALTQAVQGHARTWADRLAGPCDLADNLASFCADKLK